MSTLVHETPLFVTSRTRFPSLCRVSIQTKLLALVATAGDLVATRANELVPTAVVSLYSWLVPTAVVSLYSWLVPTAIVSLYSWLVPTAVVTLYSWLVEVPGNSLIKASKATWPPDFSETSKPRKILRLWPAKCSKPLLKANLGAFY
jgi:hypothetical protein